MIKQYQIITIDGPAASGKSSLAKQLAKELNYLHINTGVLYRAITCLIIHENIDYNNEQSIARILKNLNIDYDFDRITINNINFKEKLFSIEISQTLSYISKNTKIREKLNELQREIAYNKNVVVDGRDAGTIVFPQATLKIFLTADISTRANRRHIELINKGKQTTKEDIIKNLQIRDHNDINRSIAPLKPAKDAQHIDNTKLTIQEQINIIKALLDKLK